MAQRLTDLVVTEASLVDNPANPHARVLLWKRDNSGDVGKAEPAAADVHVDAPVGAMNMAISDDVRKALADHEHPFTYCMENVAPKADVSDPEAFCANLVHQATGMWPAERAAAAGLERGHHGASKMAKAEDMPTEGSTDVEPNEEANITARTDREVNTNSTIERSGGTETEPNEEATLNGEMSEYNESYNVGIFHTDGDNGQWYLANADFAHVGGPYPDKEAAQVALAEYCGHDIGKMFEISLSIEKGLKIGPERLKQLKRTYDLLSGVIKQNYPSGGEEMPDDEEEKDEEKKEKVPPAFLEQQKKPKEEEEDEMEKREVALKSLDPIVRVILEKAEKAAKGANDRAEAAEAIAKHERDLRETMEFTALAKNELGGLPGTIEEKVEKVRKIYAKMDKKDADQMVEDMKAMAKVVQSTSVFSEIGSTGTGGGSGSDAAGRLDALAKQRVSEVNKSAAPGQSITYAQAYSQVLKDNPGLYEQYRQEQTDRAQRIH